MPASVIDRSAIDCLSKPACGTWRYANRMRASHRTLRDSLEKTGRRLTSDPIRTSLGLLPSGPDPVGEWLVHRQSPGPYLGPKATESKPGIGCHTPRKRGIQYAVTSLFYRNRSGILDHPLSRMMTA